MESNQSKKEQYLKLNFFKKIWYSITKFENNSILGKSSKNDKKEATEDKASEKEKTNKSNEAEATEGENSN